MRLSKKIEGGERITGRIEDEGGKQEKRGRKQEGHLHTLGGTKDGPKGGNNDALCVEGSYEKTVRGTDVAKLACTTTTHKATRITKGAGNRGMLSSKNKKRDVTWFPRAAAPTWDERPRGQPLAVAVGKKFSSSTVPRIGGKKEKRGKRFTTW